MRNKVANKLLKEAAAEAKKEAAAEIMKRKAEMWNKGPAEVLNVNAIVALDSLSRNLPKWEQKYRYYHYTYNNNIFVMIGGGCISLYCTYKYWFKNVGKKVEAVEVSMQDVKLRLEKVEKTQTAMDKESLEVPALINAVKSLEIRMNEAEKKTEAGKWVSKGALNNAFKSLETRMNEAEKKAETEMGKWVSKEEFTPYAKRVDKLALEAARLKEAQKRNFSTRLFTITPVPAEQATAIAGMKQDHKKMLEWRKTLGA